MSQLSLGINHEHRGEVNDALATYLGIIARYPDSEERRVAEERPLCPTEAFLRKAAEFTPPYWSMSTWRAYSEIEDRGGGFQRVLLRLSKESQMFEPMEWSTWNVEVARKIRRLAGVVVDLATEYQKKPSPETMEALRTRIDSLAALAEDLLEEEPSALRR